MRFELVLTPSGHLLLREQESDAEAKADRWTKRVVEGFRSGPATGLLALAATRPDSPPRASFAFWRDFACSYLTALCRTPGGDGEGPEPVEPPPPPELAALVAGAPPLQGGEYLGTEVLEGLWRDLDGWVRQEVAAGGEGLSRWLGKHAAAWHQVGRVCFHLAENKRDPDYPFAFLATYAPRLSRAGGVQYQPLSRALQEYAGEGDRKALVHLLSPVHEACEKSAFAKELVDSGEVYQSLAWTPAQAYRLLREVPLLEASGLLVRLPDWWQSRPRARVSVTLGDTQQTRFSADSMLDFDVGIALGDEKLTREEWQRLMAAEDGLVLLRGQWVEVDGERLSEALAHWEGVATEAATGGLTFAEGMRLLAGAPRDLAGDSPNPEVDRQWSQVVPGAWLAGILASLRDPKALVAGHRSRGFCGTLRPYQEVGSNWLGFLSRLGLGACLADDMGLGKTVQVLAVLQAVKEETRYGAKPSLLVLPASLLANWKDEMARFTPTLRVLPVHPAEQSRQELADLARAPKEALAKADVVLTTYGMLLRQKWLLETAWGVVVVDEAQAIKNPSARQTKAVKQLQGEARVALTGTPVENRLLDLWSIFDFLCPGLLGSATRFRQFAKGLEQGEHDRYAPLRNLVSPYILRRLKTDKAVIADLPEKTEMKAFCGLAKRQASLYARSVDELARALDGLDGMKRRGLVLAYLMRLKQICNHPSQLLGDEEYGPADSGKYARLRELTEEIASRQEKVLVFTQFREVTEPLAAFLGEVFGRDGLVLHGGTPVKRRQGLVGAFQREAGPPFFVLSLKAGGTGLNLTAAAHVIHFDRWWNPAAEDQATDRAFRIGQKRNVVVHKFICRGTVEEKIDALIDDKRALAGDLLEGGAETLLTEMGDDELLATVALDIDRASL